jgi:hypothetical protein
VPVSISYSVPHGPLDPEEWYQLDLFELDPLGSMFDMNYAQPVAQYASTFATNSTTTYIPNIWVVGNNVAVGTFQGYGNNT